MTDQETVYVGIWLDPKYRDNPVKETVVHENVLDCCHDIFVMSGSSKYYENKWNSRDEKLINPTEEGLLIVREENLYKGTGYNA